MLLARVTSGAAAAFPALGTPGPASVPLELPGLTLPMPLLSLPARCAAAAPALITTARVPLVAWGTLARFAAALLMMLRVPGALRGGRAEQGFGMLPGEAGPARAA